MQPRTAKTQPYGVLTSGCTPSSLALPILTLQHLGRHTYYVTECTACLPGVAGAVNASRGTQPSGNHVFIALVQGEQHLGRLAQTSLAARQGSVVCIGRPSSQAVVGLGRCFFFRHPNPACSPSVRITSLSRQAGYLEFIHRHPSLVRQRPQRLQRLQAQAAKCNGKYLDLSLNALRTRRRSRGQGFNKGSTSTGV